MRSTISIEIFLRNTTGNRIPPLYKRKWRTISGSFDDVYSIPYIIFLAESLAILTGETPRFSGFKKTVTGIGEESWEVTSGNARIYRELVTELSEGWQRVEVISNRTEISGIDEILTWDGEYTAFGGTTFRFRGISPEQEREITRLAEDLCSEVKVKHI